MTEYDPTDVTGQDEAREARSKSAQQELQNEIGDFKWLMSDKRGRRVVARLLGFTGIFRTSFSASGSQTFFNEGQRNVGLHWMGLINSQCPDEYVLMLKEQKELKDNVRHADDR